MGSDGIGDAPHIINEEIQDNYPLMKPWSDSAVLSISPSTIEAYIGQVVNFSVIVRNEGTTTETFNVTLYYAKMPRFGNVTICYVSIETRTVYNLDSGKNTMLIFCWDVTDLAPGNYSIKVEATVIPGEIDIEDNVAIGPFTIKLKMLGDINGDNKVDMRDLSIVALAFGSYLGDSRWNPEADINGDNKINMKDLVIICKNFGETYG